VEAVDRRGGVAQAGEHDDRAVGIPPPDRFEEADPVELRHAHVGDDERGLADPLEQLQGFEPAAGLETVKALGLKHPDQ